MHLKLRLTDTKCTINISVMIIFWTFSSPSRNLEVHGVKHNSGHSKWNSHDHVYCDVCLTLLAVTTCLFWKMLIRYVPVQLGCFLLMRTSHAHTMSACLSCRFCDVNCLRRNLISNTVFSYQERNGTKVFFIHCPERPSSSSSIVEKD
jgi:hypothetical protein